METNGSHSTIGIFRQLDALEEERVRDSLHCLDVATQRALGELQVALDQRVKQLIEQIRKINKEHAVTVQGILDQTNQVTEGLKNILRFGVNQAMPSKLLSIDEILQAPLATLKSDTVKRLFTVAKTERSAKEQRANILCDHARRSMSWDSKRDLYNKAVHILRELNRRTSLAALLIELGTELYKKSKETEALQTLREAEHICRELNLKEELAKVLFHLEIALPQHPDFYLQKKELAQDCAQLSKELNLVPLSGHALHNLGFTLSRIGDIDAALVAYQEAIDIYRASNNKRDMNSTLSNLGCLFLRKSMFEEAIAVYKEAVQISKELCQTQKLKAALENLIKAFQGAGKSDQSLEFQRELDELTQLILIS